MAVEAARETSGRRISSPNDASVYVDFPVIDKITFVDRVRGQEYAFAFRNDPSSGRQVRVVEIEGDGGDALRVEYLLKLLGPMTGGKTARKLIGRF